MHIEDLENIYLNENFEKNTKRLTGIKVNVFVFFCVWHCKIQIYKLLN